VSERNAVLSAQADRVLAEITRMQEVLDASEMVVSGSKGQPLPNRLLGELRAHRWLLARLLVEVAPPAASAVDAVDELRREWEHAGAL
jgi:hypothetical protein